MRLSLIVILVATTVSSGLCCAGQPAEPPAASAALPKAVQVALDQAGANKPELLKALEQAPAAQREGMEFLIANMPEPDLAALKAEFLLENTRLAYEVMTQVPWGGTIPKDVFLNDVLPYASVNERRDNWRKDFRDRFLPLVKDCKTPGEAAVKLNGKVFGELKVRYSTHRRRSDQGPYESIETGMASCTGLSILLVDACRAVGVPARFVGIPLWPDKSGNHSWVEVWDKGGWHFTGAAEPTNLDQAWFVGRAAGAKRDVPAHAIYAVSFRRTPLRFPLIWSPEVNWISAVNVTDRYTASAKPPEPGTAPLMLVALAQKNGPRVAANVKVIDVQDNKAVFEGVTKDATFDGNDHLTAVLKAGREYRVEARLPNRVVTMTLKLVANQPVVVLDFSAGKPEELPTPGAAPPLP